MATGGNSHFKYRAHVDGLRAIAILPVIFFHAGLGFPGGYVGVDVFFVISGYLISGLILKELDGGSFHITDFWERRIRRIFPALFVVVLASIVAGWLLFFPQDFRDLGKSVIAQALLAANFFFYGDAGYFAEGVDMKPLLHTWSLAVEEQFYLVFPFLLLGFRRFSRRSFVHAILLLGFVSFVLSVYCSYKHQRANFYLLPSRAWELLTGSFLAAIPAKRTTGRWVSESLSLAGLAAILFAVFRYDSETRFPGASALLPCLGAALIIWANDNVLTLSGKFLASRPMVFIGLISYSLYLWHWPVLVFYRYWKLSPISVGEGIALLTVSFAMGILSWRFVETPFRKKALLKTRRQVFAFGIVTTAITVLTGTAIFKLQGLPSRMPQEALQYLEGTTAQGGPGNGSEREIGLKDARNGDFNELGSGDKTAPVSLLVWGDSHAKVIMPVLEALCKDHACRGVVATHPQTAPLIGYDSEGVWSLKGDSIPYNNAVMDFIRARHVQNVLIVARWDFYVAADKGTARLQRGMIATLDALKDSGAKVWILRQVPRYPWSVPKALASAVLHGRKLGETGLTQAEYKAQSRQQDPLFETLPAKYTNVTILDPAEFFIDSSGRCRVASDGKALYYDADHVNVAGAMMMRPLFEPMFAFASKPAQTR